MNIRPVLRASWVKDSRTDCQAGSSPQAMVATMDIAAAYKATRQSVSAANRIGIGVEGTRQNKTAEDKKGDYGADTI